jgi:transposase
MELHVGVDLHSDNALYGIKDAEGKPIFKARIPNDLVKVLAALNPYKPNIKTVVVESTYNWYWLVDGLADHGYPMKLANPAGIQQYNGLKYGDDESDAFFLAELSRLGILKEGYICPREDRAVRDLLRRRMFFVQQRTMFLLSFQSQMHRENGKRMSGNAVKQLKEENVKDLFDQEETILAGKANIATIHFLNKQIHAMETAVLKKTKNLAGYEKLMGIPGIGKILAMTILVETGDIRRFPHPGNYASYCRCVDSTRLSNGKGKGTGNRKNGNKYLSWAFVEAANFSRRYSEEAKRYYQRKAAKTHPIVATKSLAGKLAKACYFILRDNVEFDAEKLFGGKSKCGGEPA